VSAICLLPALALHARGQSPESVRKPATEQAPLRVRYLPWVDVIMMALHRGGAFYLPASELLRHVGIANEIQSTRRRLSGFYLREHAAYSVDLTTRVATIAGRQVALRDDEGLTGDLDLFLAPSVFERLFGWRIAVDPLSLEVRIQSPELLPIATVSLRTQGTTEALAPDTTGAVRVARRRHVLYGGALDYALHVERTGSDERHALDFLLGAEVFGGDIQGRFRGSDLHRAGAVLRPTEVRWRYVLGDSPILSQITLGHVTATGPGALVMRGLQVTNHPIETRSRFATQILEGMTGPEWEVHVYVNDRLVTRTIADPLGRFRADVPIGYGSASMLVRYLGPGGEVREETRRVEVPFAFLPPRQVAYLLTAGTGELDDEMTGHAEVGVGVATWLTARSGVQYRETDSDRPLTYHTLSTRLGTNRILAGNFSPNALSRISAEWLFTSRAHVSATASRYGDDPRLNPSLLAWEWGFTSSLPMRLGSVPLTLRLTGGEQAGGDGSRATRGEGEAIVGLGPWVPSIGYRKDVGARDGEIRATSLLMVGHRLPPPLRNAILRLSVARPLRHGDAQGHVEGGVQAQLPFRQRIDIGYRYVPERGTGEFEMRLQLDGRSGRATTAHRRANGVASWSQTVAGAVAMDPRRAAVTLSGRPLVGRGSVLVRFFLDENGNARYDRGEVRVPGATVWFDRTAIVHTNRPGEVIATELFAYYRYNAQVHFRDVPDPTWRPQFTSFSFIADPNRIQSIDVPFYSATTAQGTVTRIGETERPVAGLKVHVMAVDGSLVETISTFADGSFYHPGLPPSRYVVRPDSAHLEILAVTSTPPARSFEVKPGRHGASVEGLDFILVPRRGSP
jgi:hypothetical protein